MTFQSNEAMSSDPVVGYSSNSPSGSVESMKHEPSLLSQIVFYSNYAQKLKNGRKETPTQAVNRIRDMHIRRFPHLQPLITEAFEWVHNGYVLPSMRSMQFGGEAIERSNARMFNCTYCHISSFKSISDIMYLLMCGCGTGYSVQQRHIGQLPSIKDGWFEFFEIPDDKEGWADSILKLFNNPAITFGYSTIRPEGASLSTGGTASGPEPLRVAHTAIRSILNGSIGRQLTDLEVHDCVCHVANAVVVGNVRSAAMIVLCDAFSNAMLTCKHGKWWADLYEVPGLAGHHESWDLQKMVFDETITQEQFDGKVLRKKGNPQRGRANNSAVIHRKDPEAKDKIRYVMEMCFASKCGEPAVVMVNSYDDGFNPCVEIGLINQQCCNLTEGNVSRCRNKGEFRKMVWAATVIGTLQAAWTDFSYIDPQWKANCDRDALLGVSLTGQAMNQELMNDSEFIRECSKMMVDVNIKTAGLLGIRPAARIGCTKPSGNSSAYLDTSSGIHADHDTYINRRKRLNKNDPIAKKLVEEFGEIHDPNSGNVLEWDNNVSSTIVVSIPLKREGSIIKKEETAIQLMDRAKHVHEHWIKPSHTYGSNTHNVSLTVDYHESEKQPIIQWLCDNMDSYNGMSFYPKDGQSSLVQPPFEGLTVEQYQELVKKYEGKKLDFSQLDFSDTVDSRQATLACGGSGCEVL